ncbi:Hpt domain-containing protein [Aliikangiella marina]|uniref:Hpt domain-containing protein n=1 Tax=Aliikangiella marina TaxID=1712262 RepID=A0A545TDQ2_9GAMM|nr:Hpt domain-containing protein [Aliikangiella marina]TQV75345.1 Hpt domain-containing protein [Aliikangiella marina]
MSELLDEQVVNELKDIMGDDLGVLMETFITDSHDKINELESIIYGADNDAIRRLAHSLKGSSKNIGANQLADKCERLEHDARNEKLGDRQAYFDAICESFDLTKTGIEGLLQS